MPNRRTRSKRSSNASLHQQQANDYMAGVHDGKIPAGLDMRLAVKRQIEWLDNPPEGYFYDVEAADDFINFAEQLHHAAGSWDTPLIQLEPVQKWMFSCIYGWRSQDTGYRLFRRAIISKARKNCKTTEAAIILLYQLLQDGEMGAQCFAAAQDINQSKIVTSMCKLMVSRNKAMRDYYGVESYGGTQAGYIVVQNTNSKLEPLSRENYGNRDGYSASGYVLDEYHAATNDRMYHALENSTASRKQPLGVIISTAGFNQQGPFYKMIHYGRRVLTGTAQNDRLFMAHFHPDPDDDVREPSVWRKANPMLGVSVQEEFIANKIKEMEEHPEFSGNHKIKHLNMWVSALEGFININQWDENKRDKTMEDFVGQDCYVGLDLAAREDMAAMAVLFEEDGHYYCFSKYYLPRTAVEDNVQYTEWEQQGYLHVSPGARTDYDFIEADVLALKDKYRLRMVVLDPANSGNLMLSLSKKSITVTEFQQRRNYMSPALQDFRACINDGRFHHDGNPITRWMAENVVVKMFTDGETIMLTKPDTSKKNDGIVAACVALVEFNLARSKPRALVYMDGKWY